MRGKAGPRPRAAKPPKTSRGKIVDAGEAQKGAAAEVAAREADTTLPMPSTNDVVNLERRLKSLKKQSGEISGQAGEMVAKAVEGKSLDRKAFTIARGLNAMSSEKLRVTYKHLLRYMDDLGIPERATAQLEMLGDDDAAAGETEGADAPVAIGEFRRRMKERQVENLSQVPVNTEAREVSETA